MGQDLFARTGTHLWFCTLADITESQIGKNQKGPLETI